MRKVIEVRILRYMKESFVQLSEHPVLVNLHF